MTWFLISFFKRMFKGIPWDLIVVVTLITGLGLFNLFSASDAYINPSRFYSQIAFVMIGFAFAFLIGSFVDIKTIEMLTIPFYIIVCILLLVVDISGSAAKGAERWIGFGAFKLQPSELAKLAVILVIAKSLQNFGVPRQGFVMLDFWRQFLYLIIPFLLIVRQPDLTTASILLFVVALQLLMLPIQLKSLIKVGLLGVSGIILAWVFVLHDYQKQRVFTFLNPTHDIHGSSWQSIQSMIAVGSGRWTGMGFEQGSQAKFKFLPERHTDLAFSVWAEEHGFIGCLLVIVLYVIFIFQIFNIARRARDMFSAMVASGIGVLFMLHFLINISMVVGIFPVAGIPLSLFGYGGAHMITSLMAIGLLMSIERRHYVNA